MWHESNERCQSVQIHALYICWSFFYFQCSSRGYKRRVCVCAIILRIRIQMYWLSIWSAAARLPHSIYFIVPLLTLALVVFLLFCRFFFLRTELQSNEISLLSNAIDSNRFRIWHFFCLAWTQSLNANRLKCICSRHTQRYTVKQTPDTSTVAPEYARSSCV